MSAAPATAPARGRTFIAGPVVALVTLVAVVAGVSVALTVQGAAIEIVHRPLAATTFLCVTLFLQLAAVEVYGRGSVGVAAIGLLAAGFVLGPGAAMVIAVVAFLAHWVRKRSTELHKVIFDASNLILASGFAATVYAVFPDHGQLALRFVAATLAGIAFVAANFGILCLAMSLAEETHWRAVWSERFHWMRFHFLAFGPLAAASATAYDRIGAIGPLAFAIPPALLLYSMRQYLERTRQSVDDLRELFELAGGLAARAHDRVALVEYAEDALSRLTGGRVRVGIGPAAPGDVTLVAGGAAVGAIVVEPTPTFDRARWERLRETLAPQLATAIESAGLVEEVRRVHLATIAALSRSMEAKDDYTGGHTERVAGFAVAIARSLGFTGADLDAVEVGALLHDIGKIGIPERILHKPGPLDDDEWRVMKEHPVISERILVEADLPEIVLQIARHSHERFDGRGYPDGLAGEAIPLPARIVLVADALDALTSDRPYRHGRHVAAAVEALREKSGTQFCPRVVDALERVYRDEPHLLGAVQLRAVDVA